MALLKKQPRRFRVTHVVGQLRTGGMEKLLAEIARHADRDRFHLRFVCLAERGPVADEIEACGWEVLCLGAAPGLRPGIPLRLAREFARGGADAIHTHNNAPLIYAAPAARLAGVSPLVHTRHGRLAGTSRRQRAVVRIASLFASRVVCVSRDSLRLSAEEGIPQRKLTVIHNGIDLARFGYTGPSPSGPVVMIGRLVPAKGVDTLLRAVAIVARQRPEFRLEVAGDGEARAGLEALAANLGLSAYVRFLGNVQNVPALLARSSALVLPSLSEGISLTLLEAMARGLPVIATRVGGNPEVVEDGVTGHLVPVRDPDTVARALLQLWPSSDRAREMGRAGRNRVERLFDVKRMVAEYESLYLCVTQSAQLTANSHPQSVVSG